MNLKQFAGEVTPSLVLLDPMGRTSPILMAESAERALDLANEAFSLGGLAKVNDMIPDGDHEEEVEATILLYYTSQAEKATKSEIANAAKVIARSNIREDGENGEGKLYVTGARGVVYAARQRSSHDRIVFLVSKAVWFNANRVTIGFPSSQEHIDLFLDDINARLPMGKVSMPR